MLFAREVGRERDHDRRDGACALQRAPGDRGPDVARCGGEEAAGGENHKTDVDHRLAAPAVRCHAERNLQDRLRKTVSAERNSDGIVFYKVLNGRRSPKMPAFKDQLSTEQIWSVVAYAQSLRKK